MQHAKSLSGALPIYAQHLSEVTGVETIVGGDMAYTDGKVVHIPFNESDLKLAYGYIAHECSHVRNTDMGCFKQAAAVPFRKAVLNILEDVRIEMLSMLQYPGTKSDLNYLVIKVLGEEIAPAGLAEMPVLHILHDTLLVATRHRVLKQDLEQPATVMLQALEQHLGEDLSAAIMAKAYSVATCADTEEVLALTDEILAMLPEETPPEDEQEQEQDEQEGDGDTAADESGKSDDSEGADQSEPADESQESDGDAGSNDSGDSDDSGETDGSQGSQGSSGNADNNADSGNSDQSEKTDQSDTSQDAKGNSQSDEAGETEERNNKNGNKSLRQQALDATDDDLEGLISEVGDEAGKILSATSPGSSDLYPAPVEEPGMCSKTRSADAVMAGTRASAGLRQLFTGLLQAQVNARVALKRTGRRIDTSRIGMIKAGESRIFRSKAVTIKSSAAIEFLVDRSASMTLHDLHEAASAVYALLYALEGLPRVSTGAMCFPGSNGRVKVEILKRHGKPLSSAVRSDHFGIYPSGCTPTANALWPAAASLLDRKEEKKILFVITDGAPDNISQTRHMVQRCEASGITVIGLGFGGAEDHLLARCFTHYRCIGSVRRLQQSLSELVRGVLTTKN